MSCTGDCHHFLTPEHEQRPLILQSSTEARLPLRTRTWTMEVKPEQNLKMLRSVAPPTAYDVPLAWVLRPI